MKIKIKYFYKRESLKVKKKKVLLLKTIKISK